MDWLGMNDGPLSSVKTPQIQWSRSAIWPALASLLLVTGFASGRAESDLDQKGEIPESTDWSFRFAGHSLTQPGAMITPVEASPIGAEAKHQRPPAMDFASFNERFAGYPDTHIVTANLPPAGRPSVDDDSDPEVTGEPTGSTEKRRERAVLSPISVFSSGPVTVGWPLVPTAHPDVDSKLALAQPRPDLLSGTPEEYAKLAIAIAAEEDVDPNWVLSIMRAENAGFDPGLISSAGAVGLMQVMPEIGEAFGANDLTDPELNIRAGTRFLRILIEKYRNPVLIAAAYNAGEPRVDVHQSLPLIRETADYVTRVVGYYTGPPAASQITQVPPSAIAGQNPPRRRGAVDRARSPMLVFSVADPLPSGARHPQSEKQAQFSGPVKIVKEEVRQ
jgi:hypothetical protein